MINLSFSDKEGNSTARKVFLDGQQLRGAKADIYEEPQFTGATFTNQSVKEIKPFTVAELFVHMDHLNVMVDKDNDVQSDSWGFNVLKITPNLRRKTENCVVYIPVDLDVDNWNSPYSITDLAECIHFGLNRVEGNYAFQADEPGPLRMGFGLFTSFPLTSRIGDILSKVVPDLKKITSYAREILETEPLGDSIQSKMMQSTFISYGGPDEDFARKVFDSLKKMGVVVFFFPETARLGERIDSEVFRRIQEHDRVLLICSKESLERPGVTHEIRETLDREARDGGATYLLPITLDDYVFSGFRERHSDLAERLSRRIIGDFRGTKRSRRDFDKAMHRVADALTKK
jgi:hypothetical protein